MMYHVKIAAAVAIASAAIIVAPELRTAEAGAIAAGTQMERDHTRRSAAAQRPAVVEARPSGGRNLARTGRRSAPEAELAAASRGRNMAGARHAAAPASAPLFADAAHPAHLR